MSHYFRTFLFSHYVKSFFSGRWEWTDGSAQAPKQQMWTHQLWPASVRWLGRQRKSTDTAARQTDRGKMRISTTNTLVWRYDNTTNPTENLLFNVSLSSAQITVLSGQSSVSIYNSSSMALSVLTLVSLNPQPCFVLPYSTFIDLLFRIEPWGLLFIQ